MAKGRGHGVVKESGALRGFAHIHDSFFFFYWVERERIERAIHCVIEELFEIVVHHHVSLAFGGRRGGDGRLLQGKSRVGGCRRRRGR